jgi:haloalkane dehalogenase
MIAAEDPHPRRHATVHGLKMAYAEVGSGRPIVLLHGNPTSSYLWRNVIPHLAGLGRCIAPDLIGMGESDKLPDSGPDSYRFVEHRRYLDGLLQALGVERDVVLVGHDWGGALLFDWANRHRRAVRGIAYMETIVAPMRWSDMPKRVAPVFQAFRSPAGEGLVLQQNAFVEQVLPGAVLRQLDDATMAAYRRPFAEAGEGRRPTLSWPRQIPLDGEPAEVNTIVAAYAAWLAESDVPKLFIDADPGAITRGRLRELCRGWPNQRVATVPGVHFLQEDSPAAIGQAIADWLAGLA